MHALSYITLYPIIYIIPVPSYTPKGISCSPSLVHLCSRDIRL